MAKPFFEKIDVFLPGNGDALTQRPGYHWELADNAVGQLYYSTKEPDNMLVVLKGLNDRQREQRPRLKATVDLTGMRHHDFDGFGVHLPGLIVTAYGTTIAICGKRHDSMADGGHKADIMMSRSEDGGRTWEPQKVIFEQDGVYTYPGAIFEDHLEGIVFVSFWKMPAAVADDLGYFSEYARTGGGFWLLKSFDEGRTWSEPCFIRPEPNTEGWTGWSNNSVHGIQLSLGSHKGRLVIPGFLYKDGEKGQVPGVRGGLLYSDDQGLSWLTGAVLPEGSDEVSIVETSDGGIYVSYRKNTLFTGKRHFARSSDGGTSFSVYGQHLDLDDPNLHAGIARYSTARQGKEDIILFSNPKGDASARNMRIFLSRDEGMKWPISRVLEGSPSRYSDLAVAADTSILCLYTNGKERDSEKISVARFNLEWIVD